MSLPLRLSKKLKENKLRQTVEKFRNELKNWKAVLKKIKELELLREQEIDEIKNETKKKELNMLDDQISVISEKLDVDLTTLELRCKFCEKRRDFEKIGN